MLIYVLILAVLQGITEFLPVSSSGHLALGGLLFKNFDQPGLLLEILFHAATSIAVIFFFRRDIWEIIRSLFILKSSGEQNCSKYRRLLLMIIIASIPTAVIGFILKSQAETAFGTQWMVAAGFIVTGIILIASRFFRSNKKDLFEVGYVEALLIGTFQGLAVFPGVSRSGMTITSGLSAGLKPEASTSFSFLISLPAIFGAMILDIKDLGSIENEYLITLLIGMIVTSIIGYFAIKAVVILAKRWKFHYFAPYCILLGIILLILSK